MAWNQMLTNLRDVLADVYYTQPLARRVVEDAGMKPGYIDMEGDSITRWHNILRDADRRDKVDDIIAVAHAEYPENEWLTAASKGDLWAVSGKDINKVDWQPPEEGDQLEKLMGERSTLMPITFLEIGLDRSRSVVKIARQGGSGSGFLIPDNLLITNHHVLESAEAAKASVVICNYQLTRDGLDAEQARYQLDPDSVFATSQEHDWSVVRVAGDPNAAYGALALQRKGPVTNDHVNIVQHPGGGYKEIALYHNMVTYADANVVQYLTDTLPGSSGSPVFDDDWDVIALHHSGGWLREPNSKQTVYRNEGVNIERVIDGLQEHGLWSE